MSRKQSGALSVACAALLGSRGRSLTALVLAVVTGACRSENHKTAEETADVGLACTSISMVGISVDVRDASTRQVIAPGATLIIRDDKQVVDSIVGGAEARSLAGAYERRGIYSIVVTKPGYRQWRRDRIQVTGDACHVAPVSITAELSRR